MGQLEVFQRDQDSVQWADGVPIDKAGPGGTGPLSALKAYLCLNVIIGFKNPIASRFTFPQSTCN